MQPPDRYPQQPIDWNCAKRTGQFILKRELNFPGKRKHKQYHYWQSNGIGSWTVDVTLLAPDKPPPIRTPVPANGGNETREYYHIGNSVSGLRSRSLHTVLKSDRTETLGFVVMSFFLIFQRKSLAIVILFDRLWV